MRKIYLFLAAIFTMAIIMSGCSQLIPGSKTENEGPDEPDEEMASEPDEEEPEEEPEEDPEEEPEDESEEVGESLKDEEDEDEDEDKDEDKESSEGDGDFDDLIEEMEELTDGEAEVLFENNEGESTDFEGVEVSLDGYVVTELNDFHADFDIPFDDNTDGGVILAQYTIENDYGDDVHYTPQFDISYTGYTRSHSHKKILIPEEEQLTEKLGPSNDYELDEGESVTGYMAYAFSPDELEKIIDEGEVEIEVKAAAEDYDSETYDYKPLIGKDTKFKAAINDEGTENIEESSEFYEDNVTYDNMGDKTMIKEKDDLDESVSLRDSEVTLKGYQFTEFEPNEEEAPRFENFDEGVVLLTLKMEIENNESEDVGLNNLSSKLEVNNGKEYLLAEGMLLDYGTDEAIEAGKSGEWLQVYVLDQEQYEKIWKDKEFELVVGPLKSTDAEDISKGQRESIVLPD